MAQIKNQAALLFGLDDNRPPANRAPTSDATSSAAPEPLPKTPEEYEALIRKLDAGLNGVELTLESLGPWSYSKYKSLKKCPFQFFLKYLLKVKVPENQLIQTDPVSANVGKAAHAVLEDIVLGKNLDKTLSKVKQEYLDKGLLNSETWQKVEALEYNISRFKDRIHSFNLANPVKRILTETRMGVDRNWEQTGFFSGNVWIRGVIDLVLILESGDAVILDHKTGGGAGGVKNYEEQLDWYKILLHKGIMPVTGAQTGVHFIGEGEVVMASYTPASDIESKIRNSIEMSLEGAIEMLKDKGYFKHVRGGYCKWCEFDNLGCKSGALKNLELSTKKWIPIRSI